MKLLLENWRRYVNEAGDPDSDADNNPEPKAIAKSLERATIEKTIEDFSFNSAHSRLLPNVFPRPLAGLPPRHV